MLALGFFMAKLQNIALNVDQTETDPFELPSGYNLIACGITENGTFPTSVKIQMRFGDGKGGKIDWIDVLTFKKAGSDVIFANPLLEFRVKASAAGAIVHHSETKIQTN